MTNLNSKSMVDALYHLMHLLQSIEKLNSSELEELSRYATNIPEIDALKKIDLMNDFYSSDKSSISKKKGHKIEPFDQFKFELLMNKLRSTVLHQSSEMDNASDIDWLLSILLSSPKLFNTTRELSNFLTNMTGLVYEVKNPGRDRIIDWYMKEIRKLPANDQNQIFHKMAKYLFVNVPSNYKEWKDVLYKEGRKS